MHSKSCENFGPGLTASMASSLSHHSDKKLPTFFPRRPLFRPSKHRQPHARLVELCKVMYLSPFPGKLALCCWLACAFPLFSQGQNTYTTNGGEYAIAGSLTGDQVHP